MALTGIDAQISVLRSAEFAKDSSNINKRGELMQDYMSAHRKAAEQAEENAVSKLERKEEVQKVMRDRKGPGQDNYSDEEKKRKKQSGEDQEEPAPNGENRIDIRI